jgi:hypothetical protein
MKKLISTILFLAFTGTSFSQEISKKTSIPFQIETDKLLKGELHYAVFLHSPKFVKDKWEWSKNFDSVALLKNKDDQILMSKFAYVVNKPIGFFDHTHLTDERFIAHLMGDQKITKISETAFKVEVPGKSAHEFKMDSYYDSDDISTLSHPKTIHAVTTMKGVDTISQSATATVFKELTGYSKFSDGAVSAAYYVPLKENKTLIITYQMHAVRKAFAKKKELEKNLVDEMAAQKQLIETYK